MKYIAHLFRINIMHHDSGVPCNRSQNGSTLLLSNTNRGQSTLLNQVNIILNAHNGAKTRELEYSREQGIII